MAQAYRDVERLPTWPVSSQIFRGLAINYAVLLSDP